MRKSIILAGAAAACLSSSPSLAGVVICAGSNCVATDENVLVDAGTGATITGQTNNTNVGVTFTSSTRFDAGGQRQRTSGRKLGRRFVERLDVQSRVGLRLRVRDVQPVSVAW